MRSSVDYSRSALAAAATGRPSAINLVALSEGADNNAVSSYQSLPTSSANLQELDDGSGSGSGGAPPASLSSLLSPNNHPTTILPSTIEEASQKSVVVVLPSDITTNDYDDDTTNNNHISSKVRRKGSANSIAAGILGVRVADLENKNNLAIIDNNNNPHLSRRKSSLISVVAEVLGVGLRVVPVDTQLHTPLPSTMVATQPHAPSLSASSSSSSIIDKEMIAGGGKGGI